jgi:uncharacterized protein
MLIENFTPLSAAIGGVLIGLAATLLMMFNGRVAGISGIFAACLRHGTDTAWSARFILGLILAPVTARLAGYSVPSPEMPASWPVTVMAGVLVGFGSRHGGGCTSGHGICGVARLSSRSMVATAVFMATAIVAVALSRHIIGA